jgi:hypothetical protein
MKRVRKRSKSKPAADAVAVAGQQGIVHMNEPPEKLSGSTRTPAAGANLVGRTDGGAIIQVTVVLKRKQGIQRDDLQRHALMMGPTSDRLPITPLSLNSTGRVTKLLKRSNRSR